MTDSDFLGRNLQPNQAPNQKSNPKHKQKKFDLSTLPKQHAFRRRTKLKKENL